MREYTEQHYLPAAAAYRERAADKGAVGRQMVDWQHTLEQKWATLRFGEVKVETDGEQHVFEVQVYLNDLDPNAVRVELYADGVNGGAPVRQEMKRVRQLAGAAGGYVYSAAVSAARPADGLYGASDTACAPAWRFPWKPLESCGSDDMSMKRLNAELHDYVRRSPNALKFGWASPLPLGTHGKGRRSQLRLFQPSRQPRSAGVV